MSTVHNADPTCEQCLGRTPAEDALYDDHAHVYFCGRSCFRDWADEHYEDVTEYYAKMNVS